MSDLGERCEAEPVAEWPREGDEGRVGFECARFDPGHSWWQWLYSERELPVAVGAGMEVASRGEMGWGSDVNPPSTRGRTDPRVSCSG